MNRKQVGAAVFAVAVFAVTACSAGPGTEENTGASDESLEISLLTTYNGLPFYTAMLCGAEDAAKDLGGAISIKSDGPSRGMNAADQIPVLESVVGRGPDGLIFVPADPKAMLAPIKSAVEGGLPVVTTDASLDEEIVLAQFHGNNVSGGELAAEEMLRLVQDGSGKVLVLDNRPGLPLTNDRAQGFIDALSGTPGIEILETQYYEDDPNQAATIVQGTVQAHSDIVGIFATSEAGATGAANGLQGLGAEDISVIAYDAGPVLVRALNDGTIDALVAQGSYKQGYDAMTRLVDSLRGEDVSSLPFDNIIDNVLVTPENVDDPEVSKFLYPETCG